MQIKKKSDLCGLDLRSMAIEWSEIVLVCRVQVVLTSVPISGVTESCLIVGN